MSYNRRGWSLRPPDVAIVGTGLAAEEASIEGADPDTQSLEPSREEQAEGQAPYQSNPTSIEAAAERLVEELRARLIVMDRRQRI